MRKQLLAFATIQRSRSGGVVYEFHAPGTWVVGQARDVRSAMRLVLGCAERDQVIGEAVGHA